MAKVFRIFVEKKRGNDIEAGQTLADLRDNVGLNALDDLRIINRYYAQGLTEEEFNLAVKQILSEPNLDNVYTELSIPEDYRYFATEFLPGQYDQRADSAAQCIQLLTAGERPVVQYAKIIAVKGDITDDEFEKIKNYIINPVESRVASLEIPESLDIKSSIPADIARIDGFIEMSDEEIKAYHASMGFAMSIADLCWVRDYFKNDEGRNPSLTELKVIDTYWSDHCRHTTFATELDEIKIDSGKYTEAINKALEQYFDIRKEVYGDRDKIVCLMDMACIGTKVLKKRGFVNDLDESEEINACSIEVPVQIDGKTEQWLVQFKNETHNHPTEIEPFGGAATCLGGAIRDPLSGRAYVYQAMRVTGAGDQLFIQTSKEKGGTHRMNFEFMTIDTPLPPCMPFPRALTGFPVSSTAKVMYCRMLDAMLSKGQEDENGILFVCFPVTAIAAVLSRSPMTVKRSLNELETAGLIMRVRQGVGEPNRIYVLIPGKEDAALA